MVLYKVTSFREKKLPMVCQRNLRIQARFVCWLHIMAHWQYEHSTSFGHLVQLYWQETKLLVYTLVKAGYATVCAQNETVERRPWKLIWKTKLPPKVICFTWTALYEACLTEDNLNRRKMHIVNRSYLCKQCIETNSHLLLHCSVATEIWNMFFSVLGLSWIMTKRINDACVCWST